MSALSPGLAESRLLNAILVMLGRPGIWPDRDLDILQAAADKLAHQLNETGTGSKQKAPVSIQEHQKIGLLKKALEGELEILSRRVGKSPRRTILRKPSTWTQFWN